MECYSLLLLVSNSPGTTELFTVSHRVVRGARSLRAHIHADGKVVVTRPRWVSKRAAEQFVRAHEAWITSRLRVLAGTPKLLIQTGSSEEYVQLKDKARVLIERRLEHFGALYGIRYGKISIRNQKTRWGSCSTRGHLSFNYRTALLPADLADYVIIHELCHVVHHNHSRRFWELVAVHCPQYAQCRTALRNVRAADALGHG